MKKYIPLILISIAICILGYRIYLVQSLNMNMTAYLERAANASTIELATNEIKTSLCYLENNNMTSGHTSIFFEDPTEDVEFWYTNLKTTLTELENSSHASTLEKTNVLLKLKHTLLTNKGKVKKPQGLEVYPNNTIWAMLVTMSIVIGLVGFILISSLKTIEKNEI